MNERDLPKTPRRRNRQNVMLGVKRPEPPANQSLSDSRELTPEEKEREDTIVDVLSSIKAQLEERLSPEIARRERFRHAPKTFQSVEVDVRIRAIELLAQSFADPKLKFEADEGKARLHRVALGQPPAPMPVSKPTNVTH